MARPKKYNAVYFTHDSDMRNDVRIKALRRKYSHTGYAVWNYLLETFTDNDFFEVEWNDINIELLAADFDVSIEELREIVLYCVKIGLLFIDSDSKLFSKTLKQRFSDLLAVREKKSAGGKKAMNNRWNDEKNDKIVISNLQDSDKIVITSDNKEKNIILDNIILDKDNSTYPFSDIVELWNSTCTRLPKIQKLTEVRKQKIKCRYDEFAKMSKDGMAIYRSLLDKISTSDFLNGDNKSNWTASFDWLFDNSKNWLKVIEGNYCNRTKRSAGFRNEDVDEYDDKL